MRRLVFAAIRFIITLLLFLLIRGDELLSEDRAEHLHNWMGLRKDLDNTDLGGRRQLSNEDTLDLLLLSDVVSNRNGNLPLRVEYARFLGRMGHVYGLPALSAVLCDETDDQNVRRACARALFGISDPRRVDIAISQLHDEDMQVWYEVVWVLKEVKGTPKNPRPKIIEFPQTAAERFAYQAKWRDWWKTARTKVDRPKRYSQGSNPYTNGIPSPMPYFGE